MSLQTPIRCLDAKTLQEAPIPAHCVIALGSFDGVHLAHRRLLRAAKHLRDTQSANASCAAFCFSDSPAEHLSQTPVPQLYSLSQKLECFREEGMDHVLIADFESIQDLSPEQFIQEILCGMCHCCGAVCGFNYHFGKHGAGTPKLLEEFLNQTVLTIPEIRHHGTTVSSTHIRNLLMNGDVEEAALLLTKPFELIAPVLHGKALGRKLGFPTINQAFPKNRLIPAKGVYVTACKLENGQAFKAISNIGVHPTVDDQAEINCETYLLDYEGDLYGQEVRVSFLSRIRPEIRFSDAIALQKQVLEDIQAAKRFFETQS